MLLKISFIGAWLLSAALVAEAAPKRSQAEYGMRFYALAEAGSEYCPDIEIGFLVRPNLAAAAGFDAGDAVADGRIAAIKREFFDSFRTVPRAVVCADLMRDYGPGGRLHLFEWR